MSDYDSIVLDKLRNAFKMFNFYLKTNKAWILEVKLEGVVHE